VKKLRAILTDEEFAKYVRCDQCHLERRVMAIAARCIGGMRGSDVRTWDWSSIDRDAFASCVVPRAKRAEPQILEIHESARPALRLWWDQHGRPESGPVFPVRRGRRAGESRKTSGAFAAALRRDLLNAGVTRHELHHETPTTLPVDFHSFRRAFNTGLAEAGVNVQQAMVLAGHSDPKTHMRYVNLTTKARSMPDAAVPRFELGAPVAELVADEAAAGCHSSREEEPSGIVTASDDWFCDPDETAFSPTKPERDTGFEPATSSLGSESRYRICLTKSNNNKDIALQGVSGRPALLPSSGDKSGDAK
jgi:hypothetical protein